jgi:hypothetical protein
MGRQRKRQKAAAQQKAAEPTPATDEKVPVK